MPLPNSLYNHIALASTNEDWRELNNLLHRKLEERLDFLLVVSKMLDSDLDTDKEYLELSALCTMTQEIISMRTLASKILTPRSR